MRENFTQLYLHCVWATWDCLPLIPPDIREEIYAAITQPCQEMECTVIAVGGIEDHVHLLACISATISVLQLMKEVKGSSSHLVAHQLKPNQFFKWQGGYGAFTVSYCELNRVANYIRNQAIHHRRRSIVPSLEILPDRLRYK